MVAEGELLSTVRQAVRGVLVDAPVYRTASPDERRALAQSMVDVSLMAAGLADRDRAMTERIRERGRLGRFATGQAAGDQLGMQATRAAAGVIEDTKDAIDFPNYVQSLITGVFQAILRSSTLQIGSLSELLDSVAATADDFEATLTDEEVMGYAAAQFSTFLSVGEDGLALRPGRELEDYTKQLQNALDATSSEISSIADDDLEATLLPLVRRKMARDKQSVLATMVSMGLQRIVVDDGRLHASMDMRVDTSSMSKQHEQERDDYRVNAGVSGGFGFGPWSASANVSTSIGKVRSDSQYTEEQIALRAGLRSSVDLAFRTEQVPLDRLADQNARVRIGKNARVAVDLSDPKGGTILRDGPKDFSATFTREHSQE